MARPADFALDIQFAHGSGMIAPIELRIVGETLTMTGAMRGAGKATLRLTAAQLDAAYAAARRVPGRAVRGAPRMASELDGLRIELVAAGVTRVVDQNSATDPADYVLLEMLRTLVADAVDAPTSLPERPPAALALDVGTYDPETRTSLWLVVRDGVCTVARSTQGGGDEHAVELTPAELDALYAAARMIAAAGLSRRTIDTGTASVQIGIDVPGGHFESLVELSALDPAAYARVVALRDLAGGTDRPR